MTGSWYRSGSHTEGADRGADPPPAIGTPVADLALFLACYADTCSDALVAELRALRVPAPARGRVTIAGFFDVACPHGRRAPTPEAT